LIYVTLGIKFSCCSTVG